MEEGDQLMKLWTVTTIRFTEETDLMGMPFQGIDPRCVGVFRKLEDAKEVPVMNYGDIYERGYYPLVVIEESETGLYPFPGEQLWYKWEGDIETGGYKSTETPERFKNSAGWGIG